MHVIPEPRVPVSCFAPPDPVELSLPPLHGGIATSRCIPDVAGRQGGCITRCQLARLGFTTRVIDGWIAKRWLLRIHHGVYAVGHLPRTHEERWWGCVLACGDGAKAAARTSAAAHMLMKPYSRIHIVTPSKRSRPGMANHTADTETVWIDGLPCCTVARTLLDLAGCVPQYVLEGACRKAQVRGVLDMEALGRLMLACPRARGVRRLRAILDDPVLLAPTRSKAERVALRALLDDDWPWPKVGEKVFGEEMDFSWPELMWALEIDGPSHLTQIQAARDAARDAKLAARGWRVDRVLDTEAASAPSVMRRVVATPPSWGNRDDSTPPDASRAARPPEAGGARRADEEAA